MELRDFFGCTEEMLLAAAVAVGLVSAITKLILGFKLFCFQFIISTAIHFSSNQTNSGLNGLVN